MDTYIWWALVVGLCLALELSSPGFFFFLSFSIGAFAAMMVAALYGVVQVEFAVFLGVSLITFVFLKKYMTTITKRKALQTNVYAFVGKKGTVVSEISSHARGWINIEGEMWSAASVTGVIIEKDALVEVVNNAGSHLIVKKVTNT